MKKYTILFLILISGITKINAQSEAEFIKIQKEFTLNPSGETEARYVKELKLFTHRAMNNMYGETFIVYDPRYQELKFHEAYTRQVDGTIMTVPANAYNEVLPAAAANAPAYNYLKEMVVTHTGLELGATIYLDYSVITKPGYHHNLDIVEPLQELSPIKHYTVTVKVPQGTPVHYSVHGLPDNKKMSSSNNMEVYSWEFRNIPANSREIYQPVIAGYTPCLTLNTYESQEKAFSFLHYSQNVPQKVLGKTSVDDILHYVTKKLDYNSLSIKECGRNIRSLPDVINSGYGTELEKAVLMKALFNQANIPSELVAIYPKNLNSNVSGLLPIKEPGIVTTQEDEKVYISVSDGKRLPLSQFANHYDLFSVETGRKVAVEENNNAVVTLQTLNIVVHADSIQSELPLTIQWDENGYAKLALKEQLSGINSFNLAKLPSRRISYFELPYKTDDTVEYNITLIPGIECKTLPQNININNKAGELQISLTKGTNNVVIKKQLKLSKNLFTPAEYDDFRELIREWYNLNVNTLILHKI